MSTREEPRLEWSISELSGSPVVVQATDWWAALRAALLEEGTQPNSRNMAYQNISETMIMAEDVTSRRRFIIQRQVPSPPTDAPDPGHILAVRVLKQADNSSNWVLERSRRKPHRNWSRPSVQDGVVFDAQYG